MTNRAIAAGIVAAILAIAAPAVSAVQQDGTIREGQAAVTQLDPATSAITYWTDQPDGWHVVTTVDTVTGQGGDAEKHAVVRFDSVLLPGQSQLISVPFAAGQQHQVLRIFRRGDQVDVARIAGPTI